MRWILVLFVLAMLIVGTIVCYEGLRIVKTQQDTSQQQSQTIERILGE